MAQFINHTPDGWALCDTGIDFTKLDQFQELLRSRGYAERFLNNIRLPDNSDSPQLDYVLTARYALKHSKTFAGRFSREAVNNDHRVAGRHLTDCIVDRTFPYDDGWNGVFGKDVYALATPMDRMEEMYRNMWKYDFLRLLEKGVVNTDGRWGSSRYKLNFAEIDGRTDLYHSSRLLMEKWILARVREGLEQHFQWVDETRGQVAVTTRLSVMLPQKAYSDHSLYAVMEPRMGSQSRAYCLTVEFGSQPDFERPDYQDSAVYRKSKQWFLREEPKNWPNMGDMGTEYKKVPFMPAVHTQDSPIGYRNTAGLCGRFGKHNPGDVTFRVNSESLIVKWGSCKHSQSKIQSMVPYCNICGRAHRGIGVAKKCVQNEAANSFKAGGVFDIEA